ncbi:E3 ubiquitin-protein ligase CIP8-like [Aristolochia californica]|uniref:E3 ubiquitin-protein ligase CIP8-like n=1 Tax=Aristolochia californica TaxID=171875 RepID=UPI0035D9FAB2
MAETPPPADAAAAVSNSSTATRYWCYHCEKQVSVENVSDRPDDIVCLDCKNGFVEAIAGVAGPGNGTETGGEASPVTSPYEGPMFNRQFLQVLRLIAQAAREEDPPINPPLEPIQDSDDFLRIEFDDWGLDEEDDEETAGEERAEQEEERHNVDEDEEARNRRRRRDLLRWRIRDFTGGRAAGRRGLDLDWSEILRGLEDNSIELRVEMPEGSNRYVGNPDDYLDAAGYEVLLQNMAENDGGSRRGAPPAARSAVAALPTVDIGEGENYVCAICKEGILVGEKGKKLPCEHVYHGDCIVPWFDARNSCPVCRFELPTDDADYEEEKRRKSTAGRGGNYTI